MYNNGSTQKSRGLVQVALFAAIIVVMASVPFLGYIPLGFMRATIVHIPVIIGSILLGPAKGAVLGGVFGLTSLVVNTTTPNVTSFVFTPFYSVGETQGNFASLIICFVPRILVGVVPFFVYRALKKLLGTTSSVRHTICLGVAGFAGSMTNTLLVMNLIFVFFGNSYGAAKGLAADAVYPFILSVIGMQGVPEALVATVIVALVTRPLLRFVSKQA